MSAGRQSCKAWLLLAILPIAACSPPVLVVKLSGPSQINRGLPFHVLVREVSVLQFRSESYAAIARLVAQPDASVMHSEIVYAQRGTRYQGDFSLPAPAEGGVAIYCLFTEPRGRWRLFLDRPLPAQLRLTLGDSHIAETATAGTLKNPPLSKPPKLKPPELKPPELKPPELKAPQGGS